MSARTDDSFRKRCDWTPALAGAVLAALLLIAAPALAADTGLRGAATPRTAPELSDVALFAMAAVGLWFTRRALRKRARKD